MQSKYDLTLTVAEGEKWKVVIWQNMPEGLDCPYHMILGMNLIYRMHAKANHALSTIEHCKHILHIPETNAG